MAENFYYTNTMVGNSNRWNQKDFAEYISKDSECLQEADKLVRWSLEHVSRVREDEGYSIELSIVEAYSNDNLTKITERAYNYDKFEYLRQEEADMSDIIAQSVADYLCGFRIRVNSYEEWQNGIRYCQLVPDGIWKAKFFDGRMSNCRLPFVVF